MNNSVFTTHPINENESLACYLLRLASSESVEGISGLLAQFNFGTSNAALNRNVRKIASFSRQPLELLKSAQVCPDSSHPTLKEKYVRFTSQPYCPHCLEESGYFKREWRHGLVTACPTHKCRLVDKCPSCSSTMKLSRSGLKNCDCGQDLSEVPTTPASNNALWVSSAIAGSLERLETGALGLPDFGNSDEKDWLNFADLIFLMGSYALQGQDKSSKPRRTTKFESLPEADEFIDIACQPFEFFPESFESHVKTRLECGDKTKAGLSNRLGYWFSEFRRLTEGSFPELRESFAKSVVENFDGHDSKNPWIYELAKPKNLSLTDAAKKLSVRSARLRAMLAHMDGATQIKDNTFNTVSVELVEKLRTHMTEALNQVEVMDETGLTEALIKQLSDAALLPKRKREDWDLNKFKPYDVKDLEALRSLLTPQAEHTTLGKDELIGINELNNRLSTNKEVVKELFEKIGLGELKPVNISKPAKLGEVTFSKSDVTAIIGASHEASKVAIEQLARTTGWKSESIRYWVRQGFLDGEEGELRGQTTYWISTKALHQFMSKYKVISELAGQLETSPKALSEKFKKLGIPVVGAKVESSTGARRGGLVELVHLFSSDFYQAQNSLFKEVA